MEGEEIVASTALIDSESLVDDETIADEADTESDLRDSERLSFDIEKKGA